MRNFFASLRDIAYVLPAIAFLCIPTYFFLYALFRGVTP